MANITIKSGDTLGKIASQYGTTVDAIAKANGIKDVNKINVGQVLSIGATGLAGASGQASGVQGTATTPTSYDLKDYRDRLSAITSAPPTTKYTAPSRPTPLAPTTNTQTPPVAPPVVAPTGGNYAVKSGDTLSRIASSNGMSLQQLLALNPQYQANPSLIKVGASLNLGGGTAGGGGTAKPAVASGGLPAPKATATPLTPEQQRLADNQSLAEKAGKAGLSPSEYNTLNESQNSVTKEESDAIAKELGITNLEGTAFKKPSQSSQEVFQSAYDTSGLADVKTKINDLNNEIDKERELARTATGSIDENPFLTETSRVGRGKRVLDQAEQKINNLLLEVGRYQDAYNQGVDEINNMVTRNTNDFGKNQEIDQAQLNYLLTKQEVALDQKQKAKSAGSAGTYLDSYTSSKEPNLVGSAETGYYRWDATTKKFVKAISGSGSSSSNDGSVDSWVALIKSGDASIANVPASIKNDVANALNDKSTTTTNKLPNLSLIALTKFNNAGIDSAKRDEIRSYLKQGYTLDELIASNPDAMTPEQITLLRKYIK